MAGLTSPKVAGADLLYARVSRVEEKVAAEQRARCETEQRLTQHLNSLVGEADHKGCVSISEQLDVLREQLVEERMQRQVEISAVRATIETIRQDSTVILGAADVRLDELGKSMEGRVSELEKSTASRASCAVPCRPSIIQAMLGLDVWITKELDLSARRAADTSAASLAELDQRFHLLEEKFLAEINS
eukprot:Skav224988  [mRNA]  locus=scaffold560:287504:294548:- [translate_table: standard]